METKTLSLPRLNQLNPTMESTALKLWKRQGNWLGYWQVQRLSGERLYGRRCSIREIARELLDVAQTAVTMMFVMEEQFELTSIAFFGSTTKSWKAKAIWSEDKI